MMAEAHDPFWQAAAAHIRAFGIPAAGVFAPTGFGSLLPGCRTTADAVALADLSAVILHKGRLEQVPPDILLGAVDDFAASFANEVFVVLTRSGDPVPPGNPHLMNRDALIAAAFRASQRTAAAPLASGRGHRMAAAYLGQGRVLLETAFGHLMLVDGGDTAIVPHLIRDGWFDRNLTDVIAGMLKPGMTFIDVGANFGIYTLVGAQAVGETGRVVAIEAAPAIAALLHESVVMNGFAERCEVLRCAAGAAAGTVILHQFATRQGGNTMMPEIAAVARAEYGEAITTQEVECRTLDAIAADAMLERVDLVKIDVEGFEHEVLTGARAVLARHRPRLVIEWHNGFFAGRPKAARALYELLTTELGYRLQRIEPGATTRAVTFDELMQQGHSDLLAEPAD